MNSWIPPALVFFLGAFSILPLRGKVKQGILLLIPALTFIYLLNLPLDASVSLSFLDYKLILLKVDKLSKVFGYIFAIAGFASILFAVHLRENLEHFAALIYVGSAIGVVFSGDFFSLYIFWEFMAVASVMLIWARREKKSLDAGFRYILVHMFGGLMLLAGILLRLRETGNLEIGTIHSHTLASWLILFGFALNAAVPPLSAWLADAYPESTITGGVFLSAFTTKTAVYVLIRVFPGWEILVWFGAIMAIYGIVFGVMENDIRRSLAYSIINQVGFMVAGVGIGTAMSLNGAAAHAFAHIIYKGLLWMTTGSVLYMTGKSKCTDLGGLYKMMPLTFICFIVAALSISSFPLTSGFTTKTMIIQSAVNNHLNLIYLLLEIASAGVLLHYVDLVLPIFLGKECKLEASDPKANMVIAMIIFAVLCIFIGCYPKPLYNILPYTAAYSPYAPAHVISILQLLLFSGTAFFVLRPFLKKTDTITLDTDWFYRKGARALLGFINHPLADFGNMGRTLFFDNIPHFLTKFAEDPQEKILSLILMPWRLRHIPSEEKEVHKIRSIPVGIAVSLAVISLSLFCLIFFFKMR